MLELTRDQYLEMEKLGLGVFAPLTGFMGEDDFLACVRGGRLRDGQVFPIPILLDVSAEEKSRLEREPSVLLGFQGRTVGRFSPRSFFRPDRKECARQVFGTADPAHPGVAYFLGMKEYFVGGEIKLLERVPLEFASAELTPAETRAHFQAMGWKTIVGFQTRNSPHRAHEYLQKVGLELCDGLMIQPLVGRKKAGDFNPSAVLAGYRALIEDYYPKDRVLLTVLSTVMRYAGPREAAFHALIRRNYGCTHFIVGRDHAGVGGFYDKYAAHRYVESIPDLGITVLRLRGPYLCLKCDGITTDKTCPHGDAHPEYAVEISGTKIRKMLESEMAVDGRMMREEVVRAMKAEPSLFL